MKSFKQFMSEGMLDIFYRKKKKEPEYLPLTDEQRAHIKNTFLGQTLH